MRANIKELYYWKTEHKNAENSQDACKSDPAHGLFVVTDGAGTTLYPALWSHILAEHFATLPLMSNDPFEIEWWVSIAQKRYKEEIPAFGAMVGWNTQQKALNEGSASTLASLRVTSVESTKLNAELLVFGDSCVIIGNPNKENSEQVTSFVLDEPAQFERGPVCIPSELKFFSRGFHTCEIKKIQIQHDDIVVIATDAVAKWILSQGHGEYQTRWEAFEAVAKKEKGNDWAVFIDGRRAEKHMVDDDSTSLVITFKRDDEEITDGEWSSVGTTTQHTPEQIQERVHAYNEAVDNKDKEAQAIYYGDGEDLKTENITLTPVEVKGIHKVADALREVLRTLQNARNAPDFTEKVTHAWLHHRDVLLEEPCAANVRETLVSRGISLDPPPPQPPVPDAPPEPKKKTSPLSLAGSSVSAAESGAAKQAKLDNKLWEACDDGDDDTILAAYETIKASGISITEFSSYKSSRNKKIIEEATQRKEVHIKEAAQRKEALDKLHAAVARGVLDEIRSAYVPLTQDTYKQDTHIQEMLNQDLSRQEKQIINLAMRLWMAYTRDNDDAIFEVYNEVITSPDQRYFHFTEQETARYNIAKQRRQALINFRMALGYRNASSIVHTYDSILDNYSQVTQYEQGQLKSAREIVFALARRDDQAIVAADRKMKSFKYDFAFTTAEHERINRAYTRMSTKLVTVNEEPIMFEQFQIAYKDEQLSVEKYINALSEASSHEQEKPMEQEKSREQIKQWQEYLKPQSLSLFILDELIEDVFIRQDIENSIMKKGVSKEVFETNKQSEGQSELKKRRAVFEKHLYDSRLDFKKWLEKQRKRANIRYGIEGVEKDENQKMRWLTGLLQGQ